MSLAVRKWFLRLNVIYPLRLDVQRICRRQRRRKESHFQYSLILNKCNVMIVLQKIKFMQEFSYAINIECLHSSLQAKLLMHNCARAKHAKTCFCSI